MLLLDSKIDKSSLGILLKAVRNGSVCVKIDSEGGDYIAAMEFVKAIKQEGLEERLSLVITYAASAAAYIVLALNCKKLLAYGGIVRPHAGEIKCNLHTFYLGGIETKTKNYLETMIELIRSTVSSSRLDSYVTEKELTLTPEECQNNGMMVMET